VIDQDVLKGQYEANFLIFSAIVFQLQAFGKQNSFFTS
jgi:hypothetical protein